MEEQTIKQKEKFESIWAPEAQGHYRKGSCGQRLVPKFLELVQPCELNDYGSGTGRSAVELHKHGFTINMIDIAENALEDEARALLGKGLKLWIGSLWDLPADFPKTEWGYCADVLMLIPEDRVDDTLKEIRRTCENCFFEVYDWSYKWHETEYTVTQWDDKKWLTKFKEYWPNVGKLKMPDQGERMIFVARS